MNEERLYGLTKIQSVTDTPAERVAHGSPRGFVRQCPTPLGPGQNDVAHARVPRSFVARMWAVMALTQRHTFQVLTKRPKRLATIMAAPGFVREVGQHATDLIASRPWQCWQLDLGGQRLAGDSGRGGGWTTTQAERGTLWSPPWPLPNVWVGTSIESNDYTWRADVLRRVPASTRFLSLEPSLARCRPSTWPASTGLLPAGKAVPVTGPSTWPGSATSATAAWPATSPSSSSKSAAQPPKQAGAS
jgi:hypothetical protein